MRAGRQGTGPASGGAAGNSAELVTDNGAMLTDHWKQNWQGVVIKGVRAGRQGTGPASGGAAGNSAQMMKLVTDGATLTDHWKQRWLGPLEDEQVEVGPLLGRGGYGKVYKGAPSLFCSRNGNPLQQPARCWVP